jgi:exosortase
VFEHLFNYAWQNEFNTYVLAAPLVAGLIAALDSRGWPRNSRSALSATIGAGAAVVLLWLSRAVHSSVGSLDCELLAFDLLLAAWIGYALGGCILRRLGFPLAILALMTPLPAVWLTAFESWLQLPSANAAALGFDLVGESYLQLDSLTFQLPGIRLNVAPECSGIQSTLALAIVSLAAGYLFLPRIWQRFLFTVAAIPIGILRNALRIVTIGELCTHYGPRMIDSYIHRHGGWIFFAVSLVPFFALAVALQKIAPARAHRT